MKPRAPAASAAVTVALIVRRRQHDDRHAGIVELQVGEEIEAARAGQREIEQHERDVGIVVERGLRFGAIARDA